MIKKIKYWFYTKWYQCRNCGHEWVEKEKRVGVKPQKKELHGEFIVSQYHCTNQ